MKTIAAGLLLFVATVAACDFGGIEIRKPAPDSWDSHRDGRLTASLGKGLRAWWPLPPMPP